MCNCVFYLLRGEEEKLTMTEPSQWTYRHKQNLSNMYAPFRDAKWADPLWMDLLWMDSLWMDQKATWHSTNNYVVSKES